MIRFAHRRFAKVLDGGWIGKVGEGAEKEEIVEFMVAVAARGDEHQEGAVGVLMGEYEMGGTEIKESIAVGMMDIYGGENPRKDVEGKLKVTKRIGEGLGEEVAGEWGRFKRYVNEGWK